MSRSAGTDQPIPEEPEPLVLTPEDRAARRAAARTGNRRRTLAWFALTLVVLIALVVIRIVTLTPSDVTIRGAAARTVRIPGAAPRPHWPAQGQAALSVEGIGSLGASGSATPEPTASLAKVMTADLILRKYPLTGDQPGFTYTVTAADAAAEAADTGQNQSVVAVRAGEQLTERQLLEGLLIPSGDNIARILAAYASGSDTAFVAEMNAEARSLGMDHTTYTDPSGFEATTVSTAADQLKIFRQAMRSAVFRQIVSMPSVTLPVAGTLSNYDPLIADGYEGKTGSDSSAEGCLAFFKYETVDGRRLTLVGVVMGQGYGSDTEVILGAAGDAAATMVNSITPALTAHTILAAGSSVAVATSADHSTVTAQTTRSLRVIGWGGLTERLLLTTKPPEATDLANHQSVATIRLSGTLPLAPGSSASSDVITMHALPAPGLGWRLSHIL